MKVKRIWKELVKPFEPTPSHLRTFKLSVLDQLASPCHIPSLFFFPPSSSPSSSSPSSSSSLSSYDPDGLMMEMKSSLSKTLSRFYPLAGRFQDDSTLICNDEGLLLIHAQVTCSLESYFNLLLKSIYSDSGSDSEEPLLKKLLPSHDLLCGSHQEAPIPISAWIQYVIQVNIFECGSIAIGSYGCHKILDGTSASTFLRHWAGLNLGLAQEKLVQPNFDVVASAFPPFDGGELANRKQGLRDQWLEESLQGNSASTIMIKPFIFKPEAITAIREMATSDDVPNPTRVESVVAFLWKHCLEAETEAETEVGPTEVHLTLDMRSRAHPPLPRESMGNLATNVVARVEKDRTSLGLADLVTEIRGAINNFTEETIREFEGEKGGDALWEYMQMIHRASSGNSGSTYRVSSQNQAGYNELDFGFGKPIWISIFDGVTLPILKNFFLMDYNSGGFEAWVILDKNQMKRLEANPNFMDFTSLLQLAH